MERVTRAIQLGGRERAGSNRQACFQIARRAFWQTSSTSAPWPVVRQTMLLTKFLKRRWSSSKAAASPPPDRRRSSASGARAAG